MLVNAPSIVYRVLQKGCVNPSIEPRLHTKHISYGLNEMVAKQSAQI